MIIFGYSLNPPPPLIMPRTFTTMAYASWPMHVKKFPFTDSKPLQFANHRWWRVKRNAAVLHQFL